MSYLPRHAVSTRRQQRSLQTALEREEAILGEANSPEGKAPFATELPLVDFPNGSQLTTRRLQATDGTDIAPNSRPNDFSRLTPYGRRYLAGAPTAERIQAVMGRPAQEPMRFYSSLGEGADIRARMATLVQESKTRRNEKGETAFDQDLLILQPSSGTGHTEQIGISAAEHFTLGRTATLAFQYNNQPSVKSLDDKHRGIWGFQELLYQVNQVLHERRKLGLSVPKIVVFGESLGAAIVTQSLVGHEGDFSNPESRWHIDRMLLTGQPGFTKKDNLKLADRPNVQGRVESEDGKFVLIDASRPREAWGPPAPYVVANNSGKGEMDAVAQALNWDGFIHKPVDWAEGQRYIPVMSMARLHTTITRTINNNAGVIRNGFHDYRSSKAALVAQFILDGKPTAEDVEVVRRMELLADTGFETQEALARAITQHQKGASLSR